jgi:uncharacterized protein YndB with AHSA1/START domain
VPITSIETDPVALTLTATADFPVTAERLWRAWTNPRQLERFWGPPSYPATFTRHDVRVGGQSHYHMTGPHGEVNHCSWIWQEVGPGHRFRVDNGFATADGTPLDHPPRCQVEVVVEATPTGSRFVATCTYPSVDAMEALLGMGMAEGLTAALSQLDAVLADLRDLSRGEGTQLEVLDDTRVRITREVRGPIGLVWRAHTEAALIRRWMLGPDGWTMPVCEVVAEVGQTFRYEWAPEGPEGQGFGFTGELLEHEPPRRSVTTEGMIGMPGPPAHNELVLTPLPGDRTLLSLTITYPSREVRDMVLATGMVDGMEASYARLEATVAAD